MGHYVKIFEVSGLNVNTGTSVTNFEKGFDLTDKVISLRSKPQNSEDCILVTGLKPLPEGLSYGYLFEALGRYNIIPMDETLGGKNPEAALVLLKTPVGYRGSNRHSLNVKPFKNEVILRIPVYFEGRPDQGAGEHLAVILAKGSTLKAQIHGIYPGPKFYYYQFDGEKLEVSSFKVLKTLN